MISPIIASIIYNFSGYPFQPDVNLSNLYKFYTSVLSKFILKRYYGKLHSVVYILNRKAKGILNGTNINFKK